MPAESPLRPRRPPAFDLIETFRFEPDAGFVRLDRHLARVKSSAEVLGFRCDETRARATLAPVEQQTIPQRVRLALKPDGSFDLAFQPFAPLPPKTVWRVAIAKSRLSSSDPLLRHKTSRRDAYDLARAEFPCETVDEVLLLNEKGEVCEGTITTLFVPAPDGSLLTPPLSCGLLAGVLRAELLETGAARESVVTPGFLVKAARFFVGNSLRGLIAAELVSGS